MSDNASDTKRMDYDETKVFFTLPIEYPRVSAEQLQDENEGAEMFGRYAATVVSDLLQKAATDYTNLARDSRALVYTATRALGLTRVSDARAALNWAIERAKNGAITLSRDEKRILSFDRDGNAKGVSFHVWRIEGGKHVPHATDCPGTGLHTRSPKAITIQRAAFRPGPTYRSPNGHR